MKTLYDILGVEENATADEIRTAYHQKAKEHHPDSNFSKNWSAEEKTKHEHIFSKIREAYDTLKQEESRRKYDEELREERTKQEQQEQEKERETQQETPYTNKTNSNRSDDEDTFKNRWNRRNKIFGREYRKNHDIPKTKAGVIALFTVAGILNITAEMIYQMIKLKEEKKNIVLSHKTAAAGLAVAIILSSCGFAVSSKSKTPDPANTTTPIEQTTPSEEEMKTAMTLTRMYTIEAGDTLSGIATNARTPMRKIKRINSISSPELIKMGATIEVPYTVDKEDEEYYTETIAVENMTLEEIAQKYETTVETLETLNAESINYLSDNSYAILSDTLIVPKFPTIEEVNAMKNYKAK